MFILLIVIVVVTFLGARLFFRIFPKTIVDLNSLNRWAVVTGATDGIGKAFSQELARKGFNIVLVSRNEDKLLACADEIKSKFSVNTRIVTVDFAKVDRDACKRIKSELSGLEIGILVNNVGTILNHPEFFVEIEKNHGNYYDDVINVNIVSVIVMSRAVLPGMLERRNGLIINVSSHASYFPQALNCLYGATKSFINKLSSDLDIECADRGVHVHVLTTGFVKTKLTGFANASKSNFFAPTPSIYVRSALDKVQRYRICDGYIGHSLVDTVISGLIFLCPGLMTRLAMSLTISLRNNLFMKTCDACRNTKEPESEQTIANVQTLLE